MRIRTSSGQRISRPRRALRLSPAAEICLRGLPFSDKRVTICIHEELTSSSPTLASALKDSTLTNQYCLSVARQIFSDIESAGQTFSSNARGAGYRRRGGAGASQHISAEATSTHQAKCKGWQKQYGARLRRGHSPNLALSSEAGLGLNECQQLGVEDVRVNRQHAVGEARICLQLSVFKQLDGL
ncbi:hypothetical protein BamMEX5DRAFT_5724 [Burkholderia ambifaria MEX-5]|uniref:Uncharacterized protein n=1 Tax=Burkholderia ambifaria MEX-5 TaxID=396597 RepID=B1TD58_9BURK|nr:hypothetical protein BamMEX5DRAFT_5724 [Burkholderia ambifaria MEX-5]